MNDNEQTPWGRPSNENDPPPRKSMVPFLIVVAVVVVVAAVIAWILAAEFVEGQGANLTYDFLLLALIGAGLIGHVKANPGQALRNVAGWVIIFGILALGYSIWNGSSRLAREFDPPRGEMTADAITFRADLSGHYFVRADVSGTVIDFMVDTGATHVVLKMSDAEKIGYNIDQLSFDKPASTANGIVYSAAVKLDTITVGPISVRDIDGFVNQGRLDVSLLGMSFLNQLSGYEVRDGLLTLYP